MFLCHQLTQAFPLHFINWCTGVCTSEICLKWCTHHPWEYYSARPDWNQPWLCWTSGLCIYVWETCKAWGGPCGQVYTFSPTSEGVQPTSVRQGPGNSQTPLVAFGEARWYKEVHVGLVRQYGQRQWKPSGCQATWGMAAAAKQEGMQRPWTHHTEGPTTPGTSLTQ